MNLHAIFFILQKFSFFFSLVTFLIFIYLIFHNARHFKILFKNVRPGTWILLLVIFLFSFYLRFYFSDSGHMLFIDDFHYMKAAKTLLTTGTTGMSLSIGWPFFLSIAFSFFGVSNIVAINTSIILGSLSCVVIFFLIFLVTGNQFSALLGSLLFSINPLHINWSSSAASIVPSQFFVLLSLFFVLFYFRRRKLSLLWLALTSLVFTSQMRMENHVYVLLAILGCLIFDNILHRLKRFRYNLKYFLPWLLLLILIIPNFFNTLPAYASDNKIQRDSRGLLDSSTWSVQNLFNNTANYGILIFNLDFQPAWMFVFTAIGFVFLFFLDKKKWLFLVCCLVLLWLVYFVSWLQLMEIQATLERIQIPFFSILLLFTASGFAFLFRSFSFFRISRLKLLVFFVLAVFIFLWFISNYSERYFSKDCMKILTKDVLEHAERDIPKECAVFARFPVILQSTTDLKVLDWNLLLSNSTDYLSRSPCNLFYEDFSCKPEYQNVLDEDVISVCNKIKEIYELEPYQTYYCSKYYKLSSEDIDTFIIHHIHRKPQNFSLR